jgi:O-antigen/teichoic acid export membrane protein
MVPASTGRVEFWAGAMSSDHYAGRTLRRRVALGAAWNGSSTIYGLVLQTLGTVVLARVIEPSSFDICAIAWVFYAYGAILANLGLGTALIQRPKLTARHLATAFWLNARLGLVLTPALAAIAPLIADWARELGRQAPVAVP